MSNDKTYDAWEFMKEHLIVIPVGFPEVKNKPPVIARDAQNIAQVFRIIAQKWILF